ncbi:hypothetical protein D3C81_1692320 [compost metagenome]
MPCLAVGTASVQIQILQHFCMEGMITGVRRSRCICCLSSLYCCICGRCHILRAAQRADDLLEPVCHRLIIIQIAIDARTEALAAQLFQPLIEILTGLAEEFIGGIAQSKYREAQRFQLRRSFTV